MKTVYKNSADYPLLLKQIEDPPEKLYIKGNFAGFSSPSSFPSRIFENCLAVVGSRKITDYGKRVTQNLVASLAASGLTIVSGFMYGVDAHAHHAALSVGGKTIAVMGCGIDIICPPHQEELYNNILESGGLVVSEYPADMPAAKHTFPRRNRIVAGLSRAVLVVEAGKRSGTLITARLAREAQRKVFAVPGSIFSSNTAGICQLLSDGAAPVSTADDILEFYRESSGSSCGLEKVRGAAMQRQMFQNIDELPALEKAIYEVIRSLGGDIDVIIQASGVPAQKAVPAITNLCLKGLVIEEGDKYYAYQN